MKMIPPRISEKTKSRAEKQLFELLRKIDLPGGTCCLHSVNLPEHNYKVCGELDFVIIGPRGIYVIEVKGGNVSTKDGIWNYQSRDGIDHHNSEGPFKQAQSGMFSLRNRLQRKLSSYEINQIAMGYGVAFPNCEFTLTSTEWDQEMILDDRKMTPDGLTTYLKNLMTYWHKKLSKSTDRVSSDLVKKVVQAIRPDFELLPSLQAQINEVAERLVRLTEEQYVKLDLVEDSPRVLIEGGAGTGKTFLAIEIARRDVYAGKRVLFVCFSPILAAFLSTKVEASNASFLSTRSPSSKITIISVHDLMIDTIKNYGQLPEGYSPDLPSTASWFIDKLAPAFNDVVSNISDNQLYDVLIIDEAQDILNLNYLNVLERFLKGGMAKGSWRIFYDRFNQGAIFGALDPEVLDLLKEDQTGGGKLRINCRNTDQIVLQTKLTTGADMGNQSTGPGPQVIFRAYQTEQEAAQFLELYLEELRRKHVNPGEITILSPHPYEKSTVRLLNTTWLRRITRLNGSGTLKFPFTGITFSTVADFKGLENTYIALTDINDIDSNDASLANVYVGMSRARASLWIALNVKLREHQQELMKKYLEKAMEDIRNHG